MPTAHVAHDCTVGDCVIFSNNATIGGHVVVENHAILGGFSGVHQFCRIGEFAITGGITKIVQDVPPFMIIDGNPARVRGVNTVGLSRAGVEDSAVAALKQAYKFLFRGECNVSQGLLRLKKSEAAESEHVQRLIAFVQASERGVIR